MRRKTKNLSKLMITARKKNGLSAASASKGLKISQVFLYGIERGSIGFPMHRAKYLVKVYGLTRRQILNAFWKDL